MKILDCGLAIIERDTHFGKWVSDNGFLASQGEIDWFSKWIHPGDTVVDVGAHIGTYTAAFLGAVGSNGTVYAFEANEEAFDCLKINCPSAKCFNCAVGKGNYHYNVVCQGDNIGSAYLVKSDSGNVQSDSIDSMLDGVHVSFMKIDVEGMELDVIDGASKTIESSKPTIHIEYNVGTLARNGVAVSQLRERLFSFGYSEEWLSTDVDAVMVDAVLTIKK